MLSERIHYLLDRLQTGQLSDSEQQELTDLLQNPDYEQIIQEKLLQNLQEDGLLPAKVPVEPDQVNPGERVMSVDRSALEDRLIPSETTRWSPVLFRILSVDKTTGVSTGSSGLFSLPTRIFRWTAAAILILVLAGGGILFLTKRNAQPLTAGKLSSTGKDINPGSNQAVLTLANGQQIVLNSAQNGVLSQQGNIQVIKLDSGRLAFNMDGTGKGEVTSGKRQATSQDTYNTITTPRGGQYQITLPDETRVWLNAESSLRFPTRFTDKDRSVELTGEAYFEVTGNKNKPFVVKAGQTETLVLGTHFNIMAYGDENAVRTTLLEGSVQMGQGVQNALLRPGEQGEFDILRTTLKTKEVNTRAAIAWKEGYYYFDRTPVQSVMRQIARWYNVEIVYQGAIPTDEIVGKIPRTAYVSEVLHVMELIGIRFKIEDRKIIVLA